MNNNAKSTPKHGPGANMNAPEHAKDFKGAIKRLVKELDRYKVLVIIAFVLAILGSVISILAPDKLSELTDEISEGLVINQENMKKLSMTVEKSVSEDKLSKVIPEMLDINLSSESMTSVLSNPSIEAKDKSAFREFTSKLQSMDESEISEEMAKLPESVLKVILPESTYEGVKISTDDKIALLKMDKSNLDLPKSVQNVLFDEVTIDGIKISPHDQYEFAVTLSSLDKDADSTELYKKLDTLPEDVKEVIEPMMNFKAIKGIALFLLIMYLCSASFTYIQAICMTYVSIKFSKNLRSRISTKINKLPLKYFDKHFTGDVLSRVTNDVDMIGQTMHQSLSTLVSSITLFVGTLIMMFVTNWILALTAIVASLVGFAGMFLILSKSQGYFVARQEELGNLNGHIEEVYSGLNVVKAYNGREDSDKKFDVYNQRVCDANRKSQFLSGMMQPLMMFIGNFGYVAVCIVGALLTMNGTITFGVIVAFITYVRLFTSPLGQIAQALNSLQSTAAASERVFEFIDEEEMSDESNITRLLNKDEVRGEIEFDHVTFKYDGNDKPTINDFTAKALPGQKIAIVGPTGAGKTTMVNLLMKFYEINGGDIKIDGVSTKKLSRKNIHDLFTMVLQDTWLFNGTVMENIVYNRENVSKAEVVEVCKEVGLNHFIRTLPKGYDTVLSDNDSVSAGQRQLLTIARGMIQKTPFLILDEATSNVDTRTEELVQEAMDKLTEGRTSFIIAHRLSTIKNADLILVMKDGNIIEQGNHDELMAKGGFYADLYNSQFEL